MAPLMILERFELGRVDNTWVTSAVWTTARAT